MFCVLQGEIGQQTIGLQARMMSSALRKIATNASKSKTTVIFVNQLRMKVCLMVPSTFTKAARGRG